jgi:hypothetical protein
MYVLRVCSCGSVPHARRFGVGRKAQARSHPRARPGLGVRAHSQGKGAGGTDLAGRDVW